jgi:hypothetical protein
MLGGMSTDQEAWRRDWNTAHFRFYAELNDFLAPPRRQVGFEHAFDGTPTVKDRIESLGVPHTEVDVVLVDGESVGFDHRLRGGERVAVYPVFEAFDVGEVTRLRPTPLREPRFVLDVHLGRLAGDLRVLGFDARWDNDLSDTWIIETALAEHRIILTRDTGILKDGRVTHGRFVHATEPLAQLEEVVDRFQLHARVRPFSRCMKCNGEIDSVSADALDDAEVPPRVHAEHDAFGRCTGCDRVYWAGSHYDRMRERFRSIGLDV